MTRRVGPPFPSNRADRLAREISEDFDGWPTANDGEFKVSVGDVWARAVQKRFDLTPSVCFLAPCIMFGIWVGIGVIGVAVAFGAIGLVHVVTAGGTDLREVAHTTTIFNWSWSLLTVVGSFLVFQGWLRDGLIEEVMDELRHSELRADKYHAWVSARYEAEERRNRES